MIRHYHKLRRTSKKRFFWWITIPALVLVTAIFSLFFLNNPAEWVENETSPRASMLVVPENATMHQIADSLKAKGVIRSEITFRAAAKLIRAGHSVHGGTFQIHKGLNNYQLLQDIIGTKYQIVFQLPVLEGQRMKDIAELVDANLGINHLAFLQAASDDAYIHWLGLPQEATSAEGYLYPDNYKWLYPQTARSVVQTMVQRFHQVIPDTMLAHASDLGLTPYQLVTVASIVEGETKNDTEKYLIAGVYENRYRIGMKLQADPTVQYGLQLDRPITHADLLKHTAYNTYLNEGLPPGPINNPNLETIWAALHPTPSNYLFFVAKRNGTRTHYFSETYAGQLQNIRKEEHNIASGGRER